MWYTTFYQISTTNYLSNIFYKLFYVFYVFYVSIIKQESNFYILKWSSIHMFLMPHVSKFLMSGSLICIHCLEFLFKS